MHTKTIVEGLALAVVVIAAIAMLPDVIRYIEDSIDVRRKINQS
jgi:hypothetical protein